VVGLSPAAVTAWVERTCAEQRVPVKITDPVTVAQVGALLGIRPRPLPSSAQHHRADRVLPSQPPDRPDPAQIIPLAVLVAR